MEFLPKGREVKPLILKLSIVFAFSFTGFLLSQFSSWRIQPRALKGDTSNSKNEKAGENKTKSTSSSSSSSNSTVTTKSAMEKDCTQAEQAKYSCSPKTTSGDSLSRQTQNVHNNIEEKSGMNLEEEISRLKDMVLFLQERERNLEQQLAKYHGTQEQEITMKELESKLKICQVETRIYNLRIESLKAENQRLQAFEEEAKLKVRTLKKKLKEVEEENGILAGLHRKASILHEDKLRKLIEQENKVISLQKKYSELATEKSELSEKLKLDKQKGPEVEIALKETESLRQTNEELSKEIEQLKKTQSRDSEELVYLRWLNACLRYELRNYNPHMGKISAKDLNSNLSHESREKAKQLILEYANSIYEFGSESPSPSEEPWASGKTTPSGADKQGSNHSHHGKKPDFFNKLAKLMLGKEGRRASMSSSSLEEMSAGGSYQKSSSSGSDNISQHDRDIIKRKKTEEIKSERKALECEKAELRRFAEALNKSRAIQEKSLSFSN